MKYFIIISLTLFTVSAKAQQQTFDLTTFTPPKGWKKEIKPGSVTFRITDNKTKSWCLFCIYKSVASKGSLDEDFADDWQEIIANPYQTRTAPESDPVQESNGWKAKTGGGNFKFNNSDAMALLTCMNGYQVKVSILALTNNNMYLPQIQAFLGSVSMQKPKGTKTNVNISPIPSKTLPGKYTFATTQFNDGWFSAEQTDWVLVTKADLKVYIHYPNKVTNEYIPNRDQTVTVAWNNLVAPRYKDLQHYFVFNNTLDPEEPLFISGDLTENSTGKSVYVVLFKRGKSGWLEFVCPDKASFISNFGIDQSKLQYYQDMDSWQTMKNMATYNKFAVAASDISGTWTSDFSSIQQYVNIYTGFAAGMSTYQNRQTFEFTPGSNYKWTLDVASGMSGNIKAKTTKSNGHFTVPSSWQMNFSDISGKPGKYDAYFSSVKGGRVLWLSNSAYPGYDAFGKK